MSHGESPAVARRRVRLALRRAREEKGLTQGEVASALDWSLSKVQRIEAGEVSVSSTDLRAVLAYLDLSDADLVTQLMDDARTSRRQRWFTDPRYREFLTAGTQQLLQFESEATAIRSFAPILVPGILQTESYSRAVLGLSGANLSEKAMEVRLEARMRRQEQMFGRRNPPTYRVIVDQSVLQREFGGLRVMVDQLSHMLMVLRRPTVKVRVSPFSPPTTVALVGPFTLLNLGDADDDILYRESYDRDEVLQTPDIVRRHDAIFDAIWKECLAEASSERLILARAAMALAALDQG
jgi:transcriptional regulator with XRE-family HTH domain